MRFSQCISLVTAGIRSDAAVSAGLQKVCRIAV
jgi:hypothetical protein